MKLSKFDLAEELAIANIMNYCKNYVLTDSEKVKLFKVIKKHIFDSADRILDGDLVQNMEDTLMQSEADRIRSVESNSPDLARQEQIDQVWGISR